MQQRQPAGRLDHAAERPATDTPDGLEHRQIVYRVLFDRPATARRQAARLEREAGPAGAAGRHRADVRRATAGPEVLHAGQGVHAAPPGDALAAGHAVRSGAVHPETPGRRLAAVLPGRGRAFPVQAPRPRQRDGPAGHAHPGRPAACSEAGLAPAAPGLEAAQTRAMTASAKGTVEAPGQNVRQKAGLNRVILATGWSGLRALFEYKAPRLIAVDPRHTSQTCAACGQTHAASCRSPARFECVACGHADLNAARNIRRRGLAQLYGKARSHSRDPDDP